MGLVHTLGFSRMGAGRELKRALEGFWGGKTPEKDLLSTARDIRARHWHLQREKGVDLLPVGDFALYDQVLNMACLLGAVPERFGKGEITLARYFAMARGTQNCPPLEMTKWFDTNYHYLVPEFSRGMSFSLGSSWLFDEVREIRALGFPAKAILLGPLSFLWLGKEKEGGFSRLDLLPGLLPVYREILQRLAQEGIEWVQMDEPVLGLDLEAPWLEAFAKAYGALSGTGCKLLLTTYFSSVEDRASLLRDMPIDGLHLDLVLAPGQLDAFLRNWPSGRVLSAGMVNGRNIWRANLKEVFSALRPAHRRLQDNLWLAPSCSLLHCPVSLGLEKEMAPEIKKLLAFSEEKLEELSLLQKSLASGDASRLPSFGEGHAAFAKAAVRSRVSSLTPEDEKRATPHAQRKPKQTARLGLPLLPTTTIGSFPQTSKIRGLRRAWQKGEISDGDYEKGIEAEITHAIRIQEELGLDALVHGEAERADMVEYFAHYMEGFLFTEAGWVQSYGSRCVKPPVIYGDVARPSPMTVRWAAFAQSQTQKPVKGMLTGPITMMKWSFCREDIPPQEVALQIALALRDEVADLEKAGLGVIQIDEPAFREGLPLCQKDKPDYLLWASRAFRVSSSKVADETQIHTHMCYSEFGDILDAIAALDADVISIEASRSDMEILNAFARFGYPNDVGPGVWDIHSPVVPSEEEICSRLRKAIAVLGKEKLWVNPDCGLKTRNWEEVQQALVHMVAAAKAIRQEAS